MMCGKCGAEFSEHYVISDGKHMVERILCEDCAKETQQTNRRIGIPLQTKGEAEFTAEVQNMKEMSLHEFRDRGYLMEVNRVFFHPLGLTLAVKYTHETGDIDFYKILDYRDDPEGVYYGEINLDKYTQIRREWMKRVESRQKALGFIYQPIPPDSLIEDDDRETDLCAKLKKISASHEPRGPMSDDEITSFIYSYPFHKQAMKLDEEMMKNADKCNFNEDGEAEWEVDDEEPYVSIETIHKELVEDIDILAQKYELISWKIVKAMLLGLQGDIEPIRKIMAKEKVG